MKTDKFYKNLLKKISYTQDLINIIKLEPNDHRKKELTEQLDMEYEEISNLIIGKMNSLWQNIEKMPEGEAKQYEIFKYSSLVEDLENITNIEQ